MVWATRTFIGLRLSDGEVSSAECRSSGSRDGMIDPKNRGSFPFDCSTLRPPPTHQEIVCHVYALCERAAANEHGGGDEPEVRAVDTGSR